MKKRPTVSVLLPHLPDSPYLSEALASIKKQTFGNFELLMEEDVGGEGVTALLNRLAAKARGEFLARMDADDICEPDRLRVQVEYLKNNPATVLVGSWATLIDEAGKELGLQQMPAGWNEIKKQVFRRNPLIHPAWMMRRSWFESVGGYDLSFPVAQDWELLSRAVWADRIENIPKPLIRLRIHPGSVSFKDNRKQVFYNLRIQVGMILRREVSWWKVLYLSPKILSFFVGARLKRWYRSRG